MEKTVGISEARKRLFELVDEVTSGDASVVWIEHRDREEEVALVSGRHLRSLRERLAALQRRDTPFQLAGSMRLTGTAEDVEAALARLRGEETGATAARFRNL